MWIQNFRDIILHLKKKRTIHLVRFFTNSPTPYDGIRIVVTHGGEDLVKGSQAFKSDFKGNINNFLF